MLKTNVRFLGESKLSGSHVRAAVLDLTHATIESIGFYENINDIEVCLVPTPNHDHPDWFLNGYCYSRFVVLCSFNPDHPLFADSVETELPRLIVHEISHAVRYRHVTEWTV